VLILLGKGGRVFTRSEDSHRAPSANGPPRAVLNAEYHCRVGRELFSKRMRLVLPICVSLEEGGN